VSRDLSKREALVLTVLLVGLFLAGCGRVPSDADSPTVALPEPAVEPTPGPIDLVVLHTNDNWGETEPCG
jgi:hypothetical protein